MGWLTLIGLIAAILGFAWVWWRVRTQSDAAAAGQRRASGVRGVVPICSEGELAFLSVLESVVPDGTRVLCKVRVADVIETFGADFRTVSQKHFDFVICDAGSFVPMLAIELDDKSHLTATAQKSDAVKNQICARAGLPIVRVPARATYDAVYLEQCIDTQLSGLVSEQIR
jgi:hypothetical protein